MSLLSQGTSADKIQTGNTSQRPAGSAGMVRVNTQLGKLDYHNGTRWYSAATPPTPGNGTINFNPGYGLKATGSNGKANQSGNTSRVFEVDRKVMDDVYLNLVDGDIFVALFFNGYRMIPVVSFGVRSVTRSGDTDTVHLRDTQANDKYIITGNNAQAQFFAPVTGTKTRSQFGMQSYVTGGSVKNNTFVHLLASATDLG
jgi:hypothetical protein